MERLEAKTFEETLDFNKSNIFEYIDIILGYQNTDRHGKEAVQEVLKLYDYIRSLPFPNPDSVLIEIDDFVMDALNKTSDYAFRAGFIAACKLKNTLQSI